MLLAAHAHPIMLGVVEAGHLAERRVSEAPIHYRAGVELTLSLFVPATLAAPAIAQPVCGARSLWAGDARQAAAARRGGEEPAAGGLHERAGAGHAGRARAGLRGSGLDACAAHGDEADMKALLALAGRHRYAPAPVSLLVLEGRKPDIVFEKQSSTARPSAPRRALLGARRVPGQASSVASSTRPTTSSTSSRPSRSRWPAAVDAQVDRERDGVDPGVESAGPDRLVGPWSNGPAFLAATRKHGRRSDRARAVGSARVRPSLTSLSRRLLERWRETRNPED